MPRLGWTMEVGRVVEWLKADGEEVEAGEMLFSVESDKSVTDVEALDSGILRLPPEPVIGVELPVGATLAYIVAAGEEPPFAGGTAFSPSTSANPGIITVTATIAEDAQSLSDQQPSARNGHTPAISPRARRLASKLGIDWTAIRGTGSTGRIRERDIRAAAQAAPERTTPRAAPTVRRLADAAGIDLMTVPSSGPAGRIRHSDIRNISSVQSCAPTSQPLTPIRRSISERLSETARTVVPVTLTTEGDVTELVRVREELRQEVAASGERLPSYHDLIARFVAQALKRHPKLNATFQNDAILIHASVHIGLAVDTERGLLAPVVRDADRKSVFTIAEESARLIEATRAGTVPPDDLRGSTFTITNLGMFDIDAFTPIINAPECAILGLGRIVARPVVLEENETIAVRKMMALSLTFDHRVVDGAPAARFLQQVKQMMERPYTWLMR
jgi:pyruvate dehydrogenase E2 component (dihydrolipoamide acetyltransferase)